MRTYTAAGYRFEVDTTLHDVGTLLDRYLAPFRGPRADGGASYTVERRPDQGSYFVSVEGEMVDRALSVAWAVECVLNRVYQEAVQRMEDYLGVHAAAAAWRGEGVLLSAPMDSGKTTLVTGLLRAGFDYFTDEVALLDLDTRLLHPFPKPLTLEPPSVELMPELMELIPPEFEWEGRLRYHFSAEDIRPGSVGAPCPVRHVIFPRYVRGSTTKVHPMSRAEAVLMLAENSLNLPRFGRRAFQVLAAVARDARCFRLTMGDLDSAVRTVQELVGVGTEGEKLSLS